MGYNNKFIIIYFAAKKTATDHCEEGGSPTRQSQLKT